MTEEVNLKEIDERIQVIKQAAKELMEMAGQFPALERNTSRILASTKMLELNVSDLLSL